MVRHSPFDDGITHSDSTRYGGQVPESSNLEWETPGQWLPLSPTSHASSWRSPTRPSQNKCDVRGPQLVTKHWLARDRHVDLPNRHRTLANITGRSYFEAFCDLARVHRPQEPSRHTPSVASDDCHSHDFPSISRSRDFIEDLSLSQKLANGAVRASSQSNEYSEAALTLPFHSTENGLSIKSPQRASTLQSSVSPDKDVTKCVEPPVVYYAPEISIPRPGASPRLLRSLQHSEFSFLRRTVRKRSASITQPPLRQPLCVRGSCTEDGRLDSAEKIADDTYSPETRPASRPEIRSRVKKLSKSSSLKFGCPQCPRLFTRNFDMLRHIRNIHSTRPVETVIALTCTCCGVNLSRKDAFKRHIERVPNSCNRVAKLKQKPPPAILSEETYAIRKIAMMEVCTHHQSSYTS